MHQVARLLFFYWVGQPLPKTYAHRTYFHPQIAQLAQRCSDLLPRETNWRGSLDLTLLTKGSNKKPFNRPTDLPVPCRKPKVTPHPAGLKGYQWAASAWLSSSGGHSSELRMCGRCPEISVRWHLQPRVESQGETLGQRKTHWVRVQHFWIFLSNTFFFMAEAKNGRWPETTLRSNEGSHSGRKESEGMKTKRRNRTPSSVLIQHHQTDHFTSYEDFPSRTKWDIEFWKHLLGNGSPPSWALPWFRSALALNPTGLSFRILERQREAPLQYLISEGGKTEQKQKHIINLKA